MNDQSPELNAEEQILIRKYILKFIAIPGSILSVVLFVAGYLINDVAKSKADAASSKAYAEAIKTTSEQLQNLTVKATEAKKDAEFAKMETEQLLAKTKNSNLEANQLVGRIAANAEISESIKSQKEISEIIEKSLKNDPKFKAELRSWPDGQYCILKHGSCPVNFSEHGVGMFGIWMYSGENILPDGGKYLYSGKFGDSYVHWHGREERKQSPGQSGTVNDGDWHGEMMLFACCKDR